MHGCIQAIHFIRSHHAHTRDTQTEPMCGTVRRYAGPTAPIVLAEVLEKPRCQDEETWSLFHVRLEDEQGNLEDEEGKFHMILTLLQNAFPGSTRKAANLSIRSARSKTACT